MEAQGSQLTNNMRRLSRQRYYGGCELLIKSSNGHRPRQSLFGADYANVQAHSGSQANMAVFMALIQRRYHHGLSLADVVT